MSLSRLGSNDAGLCCWNWGAAFLHCSSARPQTRSAQSPISTALAATAAAGAAAEFALSWASVFSLVLILDFIVPSASTIR